MNETIFAYQGKLYRCWIAVSREEYPHYYWCYPDDPELVKEVGECISFKMEEGGRLQLSELYIEEHQNLLEIIRVEAVLPLVP